MLMQSLVYTLTDCWQDLRKFCPCILEHLSEVGTIFTLIPLGQNQHPSAFLTNMAKSVAGLRMTSQRNTNISYSKRTAFK